MHKTISVLLVALCLQCASAQQRAQSPVEEALHKLGESLVETCPICVQQLRKEAFTILNKEFPAGKIIGEHNALYFQKYSGQTQSLIFKGKEIRKKGRTDAGIEYELPFVIFRYYTRDNHIAGIAPGDFTDIQTASQLKSLPHGRDFAGTVIAIPFRYGDGKSFSYSPKENIVTVHCKVLEAIIKK